MRWFTCTPVAFGGSEAFFSRDSGLLSRAFQEVGVESRAVMPGPHQPDDLDELLRTDYANLERVEWWRQLELDGLVLYAWGSPRFRKVARAIREAGIELVLNQDSSGMVSARLGILPWMEELRILSGVGNVSGGLARFVSQLIRGLTVGLFVTDPLRAKHLEQGHWITAVSPAAKERYRRLCASYGGEDLADRVAFIPHPVDPIFVYEGANKQQRIISVGRWVDQRQKRTFLLVQVLDRLLAANAALGVDLIGESGDLLEAWRESLPSSQKSRVRLWGILEPHRIVELMNKASIAYCPSAFESFHIVSAEALCCGCSVVGSRSVSMPSFEWFVSDGDGALATSDDVSGHVSAIESELEKWERGERDANVISMRWSKRVHAPEVASRILRLSAGDEVMLRRRF